MPKTYIDRNYQAQLSAFVLKVANDRQRTLAAIGTITAEFFVGVGRKYDKVIQKMSDTLDEHILYMVVKRSGNIYGAKTATRPNFVRYFGNVATAHEWDWSNVIGKPTTDRYVEHIKNHNEIPYFAPTLDSPFRGSYLQETKHLTRSAYHPVTRPSSGVLHVRT